MAWPYRRFLRAYDAYQRRLACKEWTDRKISHLSALVANTNLDDKENDRPGITKKIEAAYDDIIARLWNGDQGDQTQEAVDEEVWDSPFMQAGRRALTSIAPPQLPGEAVIGALPAHG